MLKLKPQKGVSKIKKGLAAGAVLDAFVQSPCALISSKVLCRKDGAETKKITEILFPIISKRNLNLKNGISERLDLTVGIKRCPVIGLL